jgi:GT2 family glycosyltransferase
MAENPTVDVVVVTYNSADEIERCVTALAGAPETRVIVVDNRSSDGTPELLGRLPVTSLPQTINGGFAHGCNVGWRAGTAPYVLFVNPDAQIDVASVMRLVDVLRTEPRVGAVAPRIVHTDGELAFSQRRFPSHRSSFAQALFIHRLPGASAWGDDLVRDPAAYERPAEPDWVSGACIALRRADLERLDGWDERFFMYREDVDLCRRVRESGFVVRFEPAATAIHLEGASAPSGRMLPVLAASRVAYARKHYGRAGAALERLSVALHAFTHALVGQGGAAVRAGHRRALRSVLRSTET